MSRLIIQSSEFEGHPVGIFFQPVNVSIDPGHKADRNLLRILAVYGPLLYHIAAKNEQARGFVLLNECRPEDFRQWPQSASPPRIDLEEPVARSIETLRKEQIAFIFRVDMRTAPVVNH